MKNRYLALGLIAYTLVVGFIVNTVTYRVTYEEVKESCLIDGCINVYEYTGEVGGEEWEELIIIAEELQEEAEMWEASADAKWESDENPYYNTASEQSDAAVYVNMFMMLADPINWLFTFLIASFIAGFYLAFYSCKLAIERYFRGDHGED
jgi:hypothetical protein